MNKSKRKIFVKLPLPSGVTDVVSQVKIFEVGCLHLIHGRTTIWPVDRDTQEQQLGLSTAVLSQNGNHLVQVRFYGSMGNVSPQNRMLWQRLMVFS